MGSTTANRLFEWLTNHYPETLWTTLVALVSFFGFRWFQRRGRTVIIVGDRVASEYITRGSWDRGHEHIVQDAPRFMNFKIPLTIENHAGRPLEMASTRSVILDVVLLQELTLDDTVALVLAPSGRVALSCR